MDLRRHVLLDISDSARQRILDELEGSAAERSAQVLLPELAGARVPGIVRREEGPRRSGWVPVGFSGPRPCAGGRLRLAAFVRPAEILGAASPFELLARHPVAPRNVCTRALAAASLEADELGLGLGVWGSAALELYTGLPCTDDASDLDLLVGVAPRRTLAQFLSRVMAVEAQFGLRVDVELDLPNGYGVSLKELFGAGRSVIGKSLDDVQLFPREELLAALPPELTAQQPATVTTGRTHV